MLFRSKSLALGIALLSLCSSTVAAFLLACVPNANIQHFQEFPQLLFAPKQKRSDAMITASVTLEQMSKGNPNLVVVVMPPFKPDPWEIGVGQNDSRWRLAIEETFTDGSRDGTIARPHQELHWDPDKFRVPCMT